MLTKKLLIFILGCFVMTTASAQPAIPYDPILESRVDSILDSFSLEQKIGQMCEITVDGLLDMSAEGVNFSKERLDEVMLKYKVGSILNVPRSTCCTQEEWSKIIRMLNAMSAEAGGGLAQIYGVDQIHGASYTSGATLFPQEIGQAASFNLAVPYRVSEIAAYESRACLIPWVYSPVLDLGRQPLWSRMWESYGEDVLVNSLMAEQAVKGYQGSNPNNVPFDRVAACVKHYMGYGAPVSGKDRTPSSITDREMREKYFEPFRVAIKSGALSLMVNSGVNNGVPFHANYEYLTKWLKEDLQWDGMIVTDWADINNLYNRDHIAANKKDAICIAINAGIDMAMEPYNTDFCDLLKELVEEGRVPMSRINDAAARVIRLKLRLGLDKRSVWDKTYAELRKEYPLFASEEYVRDAVDIAAECMALLKNKNAILPLDAGKKIFVCGPNADNLRGMNGGWTYTWQGERTNELAPSMGYYPTFRQALTDKFGKNNVLFEETVRWTSHFDTDSIVAAWDDVVAKASRCDVIVACLGENSYCETPGNITDLNLSANQKLMVEKLAATGKPIIIVLAEGRPRVMRETEPLADAIVQSFLPGNYGGIALAELLAGEKNFSGRLPYTYPGYTGSLQTYDYKPCENMAVMEGGYNYDAVMDVQWSFGYGLSYTSFTYSNLRCNKKDFGFNDELEFKIDITNTGDRAGKESVLLYASDLIRSLTPDIKRLCAFDKIELEPGQTKTVTFTVPASRMAFVGTDMRWRIEEGDFRIMAGDQSMIIRCDKTHIWDTPNI